MTVSSRLSIVCRADKFQLMTTAQQLATLKAANCEVAFDNLTRQLYATDASVYQIEPVAVAFPHGAKQASSMIQAAAQAGVPVIPRGAGTGLSGGAIGDGLVIDFARHNRQITEFNLENRTVRVGAGVVLDQLNQYLHPFGFRFGPDVATSSRATLGGMIANDSSGSHVPVYGTTAAHINELEIILADGRLVKVGPHHDMLPLQRDMVEDLILFNALHIEERMPPGLQKRRPGYGLDRMVHDPRNLLHILAGSEGTLAAIISAELKIVSLPRRKGVGLIFFASVAEAMQATVELLDLKPAAIEHIDRVLFDQTIGQRDFQAARDLLELDSKPCESILIVEFFEDNVPERLALLEKKNLGLRTRILKSEAEANLVWYLRKSGLSLLTGCKGDAKPVAFVEDAAVRPQDLPAYVEAFQGLMNRLELKASYYGHAATGLLHVRPVLDLHNANDLQKYRQIADEVAALVLQFKGSLSAEHGVGIARTEYLREQVGEDLYALMKEIKVSFDPHNLFNPGKIIFDGRYTIDGNLRINPGQPLKLPFEPMLAFAAKDGSFIANLEQCNGCGGCRKEANVMCPTFIATGEEIMSTRGRANIIRAVIESRGLHGDPLLSKELDAALSNCLACKACTVECPSNVNMALLKAEMQHARIKKRGLTLREQVFSDVDRMGRLACKMPKLANWLMDWGPIRSMQAKLLGLSLERQLPRFTQQRFDLWFAKREKFTIPTRGRVILWDDTFVRYYDPHIGVAALKVLAAAGFEAVLPAGRKCCGRPAFSQGNLDEAGRLGAHNLALLSQDTENTPIIFIEPSCYAMFAEDYRELKLPNAEQVAARCYLFEDFIETVLEQEPKAIAFHAKPARVVIHAHCHAKALTNTTRMVKLAQRVPEWTVTMLDTGCCGMAGGFGMLESKYELSKQVAEPLLHQLKNLPFGNIIVASGTSCRHQMQDLGHVWPRHMAEVLAEVVS